MGALPCAATAQPPETQNRHAKLVHVLMAPVHFALGNRQSGTHAGDRQFG